MAARFVCKCRSRIYCDSYSASKGESAGDAYRRAHRPHADRDDQDSCAYGVSYSRLGPHLWPNRYALCASTGRDTALGSGSAAAS